MAHWIITADHVTTPEDHARHAAGAEHGLPSRLGLKFGGYQGDGSDLPHRWRCYDADGELYYEGRASEETFDPLNWAKWDAGAVEIRYRQHDGRWEQL